MRTFADHAVAGGARVPRPKVAAANVDDGDIRGGAATIVEPAPVPPSHPGLAPRPPLDLVGWRRDDARLLVARRGPDQVAHASMHDLADYLEPGDVVVVNTSGTRAAAILVGDDLVVHLSTRLDDGSWVIELRRPCGAGTLPHLGYHPDGPVELPGGALLQVVEPYAPAHTPGRPVRLWRAWVTAPASQTDWWSTAAAPHHMGGGAGGGRGGLGRSRGLDDYLARHGRPIRYGCEAGDWPIDAYQTVFATEVGSAEMPSAARGFTVELVTRLVSRGVVVAPIVLHTGVASQEAGETPYPERFWVAEATASAVNTAHATGHRVVAVGTTATRAIESAASPVGTVRTASGWTDLVITPERGVYAVDGLLTGWHDPEASHLLLVEAIAGRESLDRSYAAAIDAGYAGHEFGDFHLLLP